ncbi:MAG: alpha/beta fold hydrolase [Pseudomonadales bacterium]
MTTRPIYRSAAGQRAVEAEYRAFLESWPVAKREHSIETCAGNTFVIESGPEHAPPLVLLHGSGLNSLTWMGDVGAWAKAFRVLAVDVIGHPGFSAATHLPYASDGYAAWLDDVLAGLGVRHAAFIGLSLGGWLATDYAIRRPTRVTQLVLLAPGGIGRARLSTFALLFTVLPLMLAGDWGKRRAMQRMLGPRPPMDTENLARVDAFTTLISRYYHYRTDALPVFPDTALAQIDIPVLLIVGAEDPMLDAQETVARLTTAARRVAVHVLADVGHQVIGQTTRILDFLRS